ncbi:hypothetical protein RRG08_021434 [Elysia crispata]|uniref:Uncharacterized protein n=1 Tax=Elysia crispata TaxID=231223 RepID=A0AAE1A6D2_9GAST|nr:hypothetical protein RRG08_021434 [Elysia crispata]
MLRLQNARSPMFTACRPDTAPENPGLLLLFLRARGYRSNKYKTVSARGLAELAAVSDQLWRNLLIGGTWRNLLIGETWRNLLIGETWRNLLIGETWRNLLIGETWRNLLIGETWRNLLIGETWRRAEIACDMRTNISPGSDSSEGLGPGQLQFTNYCFNKGETPVKARYYTPSRVMRGQRFCCLSTSYSTLQHESTLSFRQEFPLTITVQPIHETSENQIKVGVRETRQGGVKVYLSDESSLVKCLDSGRVSGLHHYRKPGLWLELHWTSALPVGVRLVFAHVQVLVTHELELAILGTGYSRQVGYGTTHQEPSRSQGNVDLQQLKRYHIQRLPTASVTAVTPCVNTSVSLVHHHWPVRGVSP